MYNVLVAGAGKIGSLIACLLTESKDYKVHMVDVNFDGADVTRLIQNIPEVKTVAMDVSDRKCLQDYISNNEIVAVISSLPYFLNTHVANAARATNIHYFDLTEDTGVTKEVKEIAEGAESAFVPQCGLAPGFISIVANSLMKNFDSIDSAKLRVGALPQNTSNALHYALTWSTEGVINEYGNPCHAIENGVDTTVEPLEGLESIQLDGLSYEAFNTSGGLGSLGEIYRDRVQTLNYKTMRYPGHCEKMRVLMNDLKLNQDRETLKKVLENAIPKTYQDLVIVYVSVTGMKNNTLLEENYLKKVYPVSLAGMYWSAIQITTASGICTVVDMVLGQANEYKGLVLQEQFELEQFLNNRFGKYYA
jgi:saccharopine dehydrogenase-like NADP-dependent oxidoreductase